MRILHVYPSRSFSGLEQYALDLARDQKRRGWDVGFLVGPGTDLEKACLEAKIETLVFDFKKPRASWLTVARFALFFKAFLKQHPDLGIIHLHSNQEVAHVFWPLQLYRPPHLRVILQLHIWLNHKKKDPLHRLLYSCVDHIWCSSEPARKSLEQLLPVPSQKFHVIPYGRNVKRDLENSLPAAEARAALKLPASSAVTMIGTVSRIERSKGIEELLEASLHVMKYNAAVHLVIIGAPSPNNAEAEAYFRQINEKLAQISSALRERIHLLGAVPQSHKYMKAFDLYVLPSYEECFSLALLDAQLAQLPVIGTQSGGTPELVKPHKTGWLCDPASVNALEKALDQALRERSMWAEFGRLASERVKEEFDQIKIFDTMAARYELDPKEMVSS